MASKPESNFKIIVIKFLKTFSNIWFVKISQVATRGTPDFLICLNGVFVAIELKASVKSKISELQKYNLSKIDKACGVAIVAYPENWAEVINILETINNGGVYDRVNMGNS